MYFSSECWLRHLKHVHYFLMWSPYKAWRIHVVWKVRTTPQRLKQHLWSLMGHECPQPPKQLLVSLITALVAGTTAALKMGEKQPSSKCFYCGCEYIRNNFFNNQHHKISHPSLIRSILFSGCFQNSIILLYNFSAVYTVVCNFFIYILIGFMDDLLH